LDNVELKKAQGGEMTQQLPRPHVPSQEATLVENGKSRLITEAGNGALPASSVNYQVVHAIPGRVRFRVPRLRHDSDYAQRLQTLTESDDWVTDVRINRTAASIAITYHPNETETTSLGIFQEVHHLDNGSREKAIASVPETDISHLTHLIEAASTTIAQPDVTPTLSQQPTSKAVHTRLTPSLPILSCSLDVREVKVSSDCGLFKGKSGKPLIGGALAARMMKLRRTEVWFEPSIVGLPAVGASV
jgi:hypothetical protein